MAEWELLKYASFLFLMKRFNECGEFQNRKKEREREKYLVLWNLLLILLFFFILLNLLGREQNNINFY